MKKYELIVIGSGPAGEKAAVKAAYFGHRVALIEKHTLYGGAGVVTGTLPSKTLKETALFLSGKYDKGLYGVDRDVDRSASIDHFLYRKNFIVRTESEEVHKNLKQHQVDIYHGEASFVDAHQVRISGENNETLQGDYIIIATGSYPVHPENIPFNSKNVLDSDTILNIQHFPESICILGAGVIGLEYATIFSTMGCKVFVVNRSDQILSFLDKQIVTAFLQRMREDQIQILINTSVEKIEVPTQEKEPLRITLTGREPLLVDFFLFAAGRNGNSKSLGLEKLGIEVDKRECIKVNERYQTAQPHIYAVGDVIGFPALAATSMDQGRVAVTHIFQTHDLEEVAHVLPIGIYSIPEISTVGLSEEEAQKKNINYSTGIAQHPDMPRGKIMGAHHGMLKLVFDKESLVVLGVHIIGHLATELIHHGLELINSKKTLNHLISMVYNYPTYHDLYKYAAYDGLGNVAGHKIKQAISSSY